MLWVPSFYRSLGRRTCAMYCPLPAGLTPRKWGKGTAVSA